MKPLTLQMSPGCLLNVGEKFIIEINQGGTVKIQNWDSKVYLESTSSKEISWIPEMAGSYTLTIETESETLTRYIGVVDKNWAVCQMTVGAFTAEDFDETFHHACVPADYYIGIDQFDETKWRSFEHRYGDAIHPHVHANDFASIDPLLAYENPNWDSLSVDEITLRLSALKAYWVKLGYEPLDRVATYTPCNKFIEALRRTGIRILHSVIPEQNWSDGEWAINQWGMPTCPFWVARDDFRKPMAQTPDGVLAMTMNHYQVLLPHLTHWGDFVLSPSHFARWNRSCDSGPLPVRFEQFARDTIANAAANSDYPLFFVAGFEFGRTFGTGIMTDYNRRGIETLIKLAKHERMVFACSRDVYAYYARHIPAIAERVLYQRDNWAGARTMGKPGMTDDAVVIERLQYKSLIREGKALPWFHYDYLQPWNYATAAIDIPDNFAESDRTEIRVEEKSDIVTLTAEKPLERTIPVVLWNARIENTTGLKTSQTASLDNEITHTLVEMPKGWYGRCEIKIKKVCSENKPVERPIWWQTKTFGEGDGLHTYLHLDLEAIKDIEVPIELETASTVDGPQCPLGTVPAGIMKLTIGPHRTWHRFWGIGAEHIRPSAETHKVIANLRHGIDLLNPDWQAESKKHCQTLESAMLEHTGINQSQVLLSVLCGAGLGLGSRSRAIGHDIVNSRIDGLTAHEYSDGAISYGPGKTFWMHPRGLSFKIRGMDTLRGENISVILNSFDPHQLGTKYKVKCAGNEQPDWQLPLSPFDTTAWYCIDVDWAWISTEGILPLHLQTDQKQVLYDWWKEKGFVAGLHALWVIIGK